MGKFDQKSFNKFIEENNVYGFFDEPITLNSGRQTHFYANWRDIVKDVWLMDKLADYVLSFVKDNGLEVDTFYGVPEGATKLGIILQYKLAKMDGDYSKGSHTLAMGRGKPKEHGLPRDRFFVGVPSGKVVVIEDVTTTGASLIKTLDRLNETGINVVGVISLTNRMEKRDDGLSVKEIIENRGVKFYSMSSSLELLPIVYNKLKPNEMIGKEIESEFERYGVNPINLINHQTHLSDRLLEKIDEKQNPCVVGLDPVVEKIPQHLIKGDSFEDIANSFREFNFAIIDSICDLVPAVKPQMAFYEKYGAPGVKAFKDTVDYARSKGLIVIEDGKRNDIGSTAQAYAEGHLGVVKTKSLEVPSFDLDLLTVNPYLGSDGLKPFVDVCKEYKKGIFILVKTSNPSSGEFQDKFVETTEEEKFELRKLGIEVYDKTRLYNLVALQVNKYAQQDKGERGYSSIGAVVGATYPGEAEVLRKIMPNSFFLVPGYGSQGGSAEDVVPCFNSDGYGAVVNSARGIIYAYQKNGDPEKFAEAAREATKLMVEDIRFVLKKHGKFPLKWRN